MAAGGDGRREKGSSDVIRYMVSQRLKNELEMNYGQFSATGQGLLSLDCCVRETRYQCIITPALFILHGSLLLNLRLNATKS